jgi:AcrR family transcriptional regulator
MRDKIVDSAMEQIKKYGFRRFTIGDITDDLGISTKTVYKYFEGKDVIISAVVIALIESIKEKIIKTVSSDEPWFDQMNALLSKDKAVNEQIFFELKKHYPAEWKKFLEAHNELSRHLMDFMKRGIASRDVRPDVDLNLLDVIMRICTDTLSNTQFNNYSTKQVLDLFHEVIMFGIISPDSKMRRLTPTK